MYRQLGGFVLSCFFLVLCFIFLFLFSQQGSEKESNAIEALFKLVKASLELQVACFYLSSSSRPAISVSWRRMDKSLVTSWATKHIQSN